MKPHALGLSVAFFLALAPDARAQHLVFGADSLHPRLVFADSLRSANDRCMVTQKKLNPRVRPVYVNGVPMGFC
jgi:hypothetical protein